MRNVTDPRPCAVGHAPWQKESVMASCSEMKVGETYVCEQCDLEIQVVRSCADSEEGACACAESLSCCGGPLVLKS